MDEKHVQPVAQKAGSIDRRQFLKQATIGTAALLTAPAVGKVLGANDRINIGVIGCGGRGGDHLRRLVNMGKSGSANVQVIAVCDIYEPRKNAAKQTCGGELYHDYRKLLENKDVDAVWITTPDHWHETMAVDAMEAGKDIYVEKPMTRYLDEAKRLYQTHKRTGRVVQVGSQGCSQPKWNQAHGLIKQGKLGKVVWAQTSYSRNSTGGEWNYPIDKDASPQNLDWKAWLGPAPERPFDKERYFRWRKYWDYSGGVATDLYPHKLQPLLKALGADFPRRVVAAGGIYVQKDREVPDTFHTLIDYPGEFTVLIVSSMANEKGLADTIYGHEATMDLSGSVIQIRPERIFAEGRDQEQIPTDAVADETDAHVRNFLDCVRSRNEPDNDADLGYKCMVAVDLAIRSYRENRAMLFDPVKEEVI